MNDKFQAIRDLLHPVSKIRSEELLPGFEFTPQQEYAIVVDMDGQKKIVNHCSEQYHLVPNQEIIDPLAKALEGYDYDIVGSQRHDSRFSFDVIFKDTSLAINSKKDIMMPKLKVNNSYDGRVKYSFNMGFFRLICSNGMVIPMEGFEDKNVKIKMRHTPSLEKYVEGDAVIDMVETFKEHVKEFMEPFNYLQTKEVKSLEDRVMEVIENTKFPSRRAEDVLDRIEEEKVLLHYKTNNDWLVYNSFNYQLNHSRDINMDAHKKENLDRQVLAFLMD